MLQKDFNERSVIVNQINGADIVRDYNQSYLSLLFKVSGDAKTVESKGRIPVEMVARKKDRAPILFLLHVVEGRVSELEVLYADSSQIDADLTLDDAEIYIEVRSI